MPSELESGRLLLSEKERREYARAAIWLADNLDKHIPLDQPMSRGEYVDLMFALFVIRKDRKSLNEMATLLEAEIERRRNQH